MLKKTLFLALLFLVSNNTQAAKILYFGDSHSVATVGPFGIRMNQLLRALPNAEVITHARCGSIMSWWYSGKPTACGYFDQDTNGIALPPVPVKNTPWDVKADTPIILSEIETAKPDLIVVEMGGNYTMSIHPLETIKEELSLFISDLKKSQATGLFNSNCVWIGPPARRDHMETMPPLVDAIRAAVEPTCTFIDSTTMTVYPTQAADGGPLHGGKDGIHYSFLEGIPVANAWAEKAFLTVKTQFDKITP